MPHPGVLQLRKRDQARDPSSSLPYQINEIFFSLQGEGVRAGSPNVFVRFSGCNQACLRETHGFDCDTEFVSGTRMSVEGVIEECEKLAPKCKWLILTGGEPLLQVDDAFVGAMKSAGFKLAVETNGSINPSPEVMAALDWIACSPKVAEHAVRLERCDELRYVRGYGQGIPKPKLTNCEHKLISPAFEGNNLPPRTFEWCVQLVKDNPEWRLSIQQHKLWGVR